jgi:hypothetical protein
MRCIKERTRTRMWHTCDSNKIDLKSSSKFGFLSHFRLARIFEEVGEGRLHEGSINHKSNRGNPLTEMIETSYF